MTQFYLQVTNRNFSSVPVMPPYLTPVFNTMRWSVFGGPVQASVTMYGPMQNLFDLINSLRSQVMIYDNIAEPIWWGYIHEIQVRMNAMEIGVSIDTMFNRICVEYNAILPGQQAAGERFVTDWNEYTSSILEYGTKEFMASLTDATAEAAESFRDRLLDQRKLPVPVWYPSDAEASASATLSFRGWWDTLDWLMYSNPAGYEGYEESGEGVQNIGETSDNEQVAQSFSIEFDEYWEASTISIRVRKEGTPGGNMVVALCSNSGGVPGSVLASGVATPANVPTDYNWVNITLSSKIPLVYGTTYWVKISRADAVDADNYYVVNVNEELGYTRGVLRVYDGADWNVRDPDADMQFRVTGVQDTAEQMDRIFTQSGQFIQGVRFTDGNSGVYSVPYRAGDMTALVELEELLQIGTSNQRRMLARVAEDRYVEVYEEPAKAEGEYSLTSTGQVWRRNVQVPPHKIPYGQWLVMKDVLPGVIDAATLADPSLIFIEETQYNPSTNKLTLYPRTMASPWDIGMSFTNENK